MGSMMLQLVSSAFLEIKVPVRHNGACRHKKH